MGLFKNDKNPCPICGGATPRLFPRKVEGQPLCKDCDNLISMEDTLKNALTLDGLREHLEFRKENAALHQSFSRSRMLEFNDAMILKQRVCIDDAQGLWYIEDGENPPIFRIDELVSFRLKEDDLTVIQIDHNGLKTQPSVVEPFMQRYGGIVGGLYSVTNTLNLLAGNKDKKDNEPKINAPFCNFYLEFTVNNRYWKTLHRSFSAPAITNNDIPAYLQRYGRDRAIADSAAQELATLFKVGAADSRGGGGGDAGQVADDLIKFKKLLDGGIITQEEFNAKKKQLLGI